MAMNSDLYLTLKTLDDNINDSLMAMRTPPPFRKKYSFSRSVLKPINKHRINCV